MSRAATGPAVVAAPAAPAMLPPPGLPGLDADWSRLVVAPDCDDVPRTWHVLDNGVADARLTVLAVHGNPTWSYLWRRLLAQAPADVRVIAVDQLDMGYSERTGRVRRLADRVDDLDRLVEVLDITSPVVTVAHDWGGPVSLGWATRHVDRLAGVVLTNTAVHQPAGSPAPALIRAARSPAVLRTMTVRTDGFVRGTTTLSGSRMPDEVAAAFRAPYATADRRAAVGTFVADIPLEDDHPSMPALQAVAAGLDRLVDVPVLMLWGPGDPVFSDLYLRDLLDRLPHADAHRYEGARHLVTEDAPAAIDDLLAWLALLPASTPEQAPAVPDTGRPIWAGLLGRAADGSVAVAEPLDGGWRHVSWRLLAQRVDQLAAGLAAVGVQPGDRVALLVPPGADLIAAVYACWRAGAVVVVADAGLGVPGMRRALRGAGPRHVIAVAPGLALARSLSVPGRTVAVGIAGPAARALGASRGPGGEVLTLPALVRLGAQRPVPDGPTATDDAVVVFTSGATGPAKGVVYRHGQLQAQRDALAGIYGIGPDDALVAAFAPWSVLGPALGIASAIPEMELTAARTLTAAALAEATAQVRGTLLWASPAALQGVVATGDALTPGQRADLGSIRLLMGAGAPVPAVLLRRAADLMPGADARTPYGMTEALPLTDVTLAEIEAAGPGQGVLVGAPIDGVEIAIAPLDALGRATDRLGTAPDVTGEIAVRAAWTKDRYDRLWAAQQRSTQDGAGWHRTGDVGHLDDRGRLWVEGRLAHVVATDRGPVTPVGVEQRVEQVPAVAAAACVGVGPVGVQQVVLVVATVAPARRARLAEPTLADAVRDRAGVDVAAVLVVPALPVDVRHNSKIDRARLSAWADEVLAGARLREP